MSNEIAAAAMTKGAIKGLHESIKEFNDQSSRQTEKMLRLTRVIIFLAVIMALEVGFQIYLAIQV